MKSLKRSTSILSASLFAATLFTASVIPAFASDVNLSADPVIQLPNGTPPSASIRDVLDPIISPMAVIGNANFSTGQGGLAFEFKGKSQGENVQFAIKNSSNHPFTLELISPSGYIWINGTIDANSSSTYQMFWTSANSGWWIVNTKPINGYPYSGSYNVRDGL